MTGSWHGLQTNPFTIVQRWSISGNCRRDRVEQATQCTNDPIDHVKLHSALHVRSSFIFPDINTKPDSCHLGFLSFASS